MDVWSTRVVSVRAVRACNMCCWVETKRGVFGFLGLLLRETKRGVFGFLGLLLRDLKNIPLARVACFALTQPYFVKLQSNM